jgi:hypothetical protein
MAEHAAHRSPDDQYLETPPGAGYEHTDASISPLVHFAFWLVVSAVIVHVGLAGFYWFMQRQSAVPQQAQQYPLATEQSRRLPAEPRLQQIPSQDMYQLRLRQEDQLHSYGWVDKSAGTVHIPIDEAMSLALQRGLYTSRPTDASQPVTTVEEFPSDSSSGRVLEKRRQ